MPVKILKVLPEATQSEPGKPDGTIVPLQDATSNVKSPLQDTTLEAPSVPEATSSLPSQTAGSYCKDVSNVAPSTEQDLVDSDATIIYDPLEFK